MEKFDGTAEGKDGAGESGEDRSGAAGKQMAAAPEPASYDEEFMLALGDYPVVAIEDELSEASTDADFERELDLIFEEDPSLKDATLVYDSWYPDYWAQSWYRNTFLVRWPKQIGVTIDDAEWNTISDCGCNFTCLAMIIGIDPGRLASELAAVAGFFTADRDYPARCFDGAEHGLVWDQNRPYAGETLVLPDIWHPRRKCRTTITVEKRGENREAKTIEAANALVAEAHGRGHYVICGPYTHSMLVAGVDIWEDYFLWDPNADKTPVEQSVGGELTLESLFGRGEPVEFALYSVTFADGG